MSEPASQEAAPPAYVSAHSGTMKRDADGEESKGAPDGRDTHEDRKEGNYQDTGPYSQTWVNYSSVVLNLDECTVYDNTSPYINIITSPASTLSKIQGSQTLSFEQTWTTVNVDPCYGRVVWKDPNTGCRYGITIEQGMQVSSLGWAPYWTYKTNDTKNAGYNDWVNPVANPGDPFTFPPQAGDKLVVNTKTTAAHHQSLVMTITITDAK
ncbi:hypothetical protein PMZ80_000879 [Knufia obscura]|uniref:Uncharacterized protein n=1 Tax=Knufia obscura TaxID=1635080 RepID=A0ABR0S1N7_9EURO|nr:hypothetical protein PMZ80_000879 [Knufia obscura]